MTNNPTSLHNANVLVTGAGGFIASHLVQALLARGARVRAFVRYNSRNDLGLLAQLSPDELERVEIIAGDLRDLPAVQAALEGCELVFHLGALIAIPYSYVHPLEVIESNVLGTTNVLLAARQHSTRRVIHTSTSEVYGTALRVPIDEEHPLQGQSPYSASKIAADKIAESFYCAYDLPVVTVRPFNTFGPRQSARAVIPTIIAQALTGDTLQLGSLDTRRDFTYVDDTVSGFLCAAEAPDSVLGQVYNLGTGQDMTIGEIVEQVACLLDKPLSVTQDAQRLRPGKSEVMRLLSDNSKARAQLGWAPAVSLEEGLQRTVEWIRDHLDAFQPGHYQR
jgi:NAD dependent epimerase/dehydratase